MSYLAKENLKGLRDDQEPEVDEEKDEKLPMGERMIILRDKLKLGPHHKMERFTIMFSVTVLFLGLFAGTALKKDIVRKKTIQSTQAVFTDGFKFSRSGQSGKVINAYSSPERTETAILFKMTDISEMTTDTRNYQLFVTGKEKAIKYEPYARFSLFGTTGYGMVYFEHTEPFPQEILDITIRSNKEFAKIEGSGGVDQSFRDYDQARMYINIGAKNIAIVEDLKEISRDPVRVFTQFFAIDKDKVVHKEIAATTEELDRLIRKASEYKNRIDMAGYIPPMEPTLVRGDYIDDDNVLRPTKNVEGAYIFDYWSKSITDGYLNQVIRDMSAYTQYMAKMTGPDVDYDDDGGNDKEVNDEGMLRHEDGTVLDLTAVVTGESPTDHVEVKEAVQSLKKIWEQYINEKTKLQRDLMRDLIKIDADVQSQDVGYSETENAVTYY